ncbi:MAG: AAA family ATPase [Methylovulum sp.]
MKILNLHFKNIKSFAGEHHINFEQAPFIKTGVFAITGANGAGKSSILDAITLGLYGETFRFENPAHFVITQQTTEAFSFVDFALDNERYQAQWLVHTLDAEDPQAELNVTMRLLRQSDGVELASSVHDVCAQITQLTGMNFRNFSRSMLLAQGDFSAFLNALDNERMDILEHIVGNDIYQEYTKDLTDKVTKAKLDMQHIEEELACYQPMDANKLNALQEDLADYQEQYVELQQQRNQRKQQKSALDTRAKIEQKLNVQQRALELLTVKINTLDDSLSALHALEAAQLFTEVLTERDETERLVKQNQQSVTQLDNECARLQQQWGDVIALPTAAHELNNDTPKQQRAILHNSLVNYQVDRQAEEVVRQALSIQYSEKLTAITEQETWLLEHQSENTLLAHFPETTQLKELRADLNDLYAQQTVCAKDIKQTQTALASSTVTLEKANAKTQQLHTSLKAQELNLLSLTKDISAEALDGLKTEQIERIAAFQQWYDLAKSYKKVAKSTTSWWSFLSNTDAEHDDVDALSNELNALTLSLRQEENIKLVLEEVVARESLLKRLAPERQHLNAGKPCHLCGATDHPFITQAPALTNSSQALHDQKIKIKTLEETASSIQHRITQAQNWAEKNTTTSLQLTQIKARWISLSNRLNITTTALTISDLPQLHELLNAQHKELKAIEKLQNQHKNNTASQIKLTEALAQQDIISTDATNKLKQLQHTLELHQQRHLELDTQLQALQAEEQQLSETVLKQLTALGETLPSKGKEEAFFERLNERRRTFQEADIKKTNLTEDLPIITAKIQKSEQEINRYDQLIAETNQQIAAQERLLLQLAYQDLVAQRTTHHTHLKQLETNLITINQHLQEKLDASQFATLAELENARQRLASQAKVQADKAALLQEQSVMAEKYARQQTELATHIAELPYDLSHEEIDEALKQLNEKMLIVEMERQRLEKLVKQEAQALHTYQTIAQQHAKQQALLTPLLDDVEDLNSSAGINLRRRVQHQLAQQLLTKTNHILEKISGRYYLHQAASEQGLALEIEDTKQAHSRRLPKTLSGGESFIVSLALALSLAELANNGHSVDSLFIDEGFGNLDAESLYIVISALERLPAQGKTVGVISHIEAVQKRIKAQIKVIKKPNGYGELKRV